MNAGVSRFVPSEDLFQQVAADGVKNTITLFEDSRRNLWVGSSGNGLYLLEKKDKQLVQKLKPSDSKGVLQVRSIVEWIPGELLIASDEGLTSYNIVTGKGETLRSDYRQTNGLNDNYLQTLFVDHEQASCRHLFWRSELYSTKQEIVLYTIIEEILSWMLGLSASLLKRIKIIFG